MYDYGPSILDKNEENRAIEWAESGYAWDQYCVGNMYDHGRCVQQNDITAVKWYILAAKQGYADAQYNLGNMFSNGRGVPQHNKTAVKLLTLAAEQGHTQAQFNLEILGERLKLDIPKA